MNLINAKNILFILLGVDLALASLVGINAYISIATVEEVRSGIAVVDDAMIDRLTFWEGASKLTLLTMLAVGIAIVYWLKSSYRHAREVIGATGFKQEGWAFWGWVTPVLNLFKPYKVIMELYRAGDAQYSTPEGWKESVGSGVMLFWWIVWVALHFMMVMAFNIVNQATGATEITWAQYSHSLEFQVFAIVLGVIVSVFWFAVVNHLTRRLIERAPLLAHASGGQPMNRVQPAPLRPMPAGNAAVMPPQPTRPMQPVGSAKGTTTQAPIKADIDPSQSVIDEEAIYEQVANEIESGNVRKGLWTRIWTEFDGDDSKVKLAYIKTRVAQIATERQEAQRVAAETHVQQEAERVRLQELAASKAKKNKAEIETLLRRLKTDCSIDEEIRLFECMGGKFKWVNDIYSEKCIAEYLDQRNEFSDGRAFSQWLAEHVVPIARHLVARSLLEDAQT